MIYLTYSNTSHTDGLAAQLYRIYGIYCLSRHLGFEYMHTPLEKIDHQGLSVLQSQKPDASLAQRANNLFYIPGKTPPASAKYVDVSDPVLGFEEELQTYADQLSTDIVARITHPHHVLDKTTEAWDYCADVSPYNTPPKNRDNKNIRIAVHIRRGDLHILEKKRLLPNDYYIKIIEQLSELFSKTKTPHVFEIHSEKANSDFSVQPSDYGIYGLEKETHFPIDADAFDDFDKIDNLKLILNEETLSSFENIASADIIITSKSCFSYLGAVLNRNALTIYHPFWHAPLPDWIVTRGELDTTSIEHWISNRIT